MRNLIKNFFDFAGALVMFDLIILLCSMGQIAAGQETGYWNGFWRIQAEVLIKLMQ